MKNRYVYGVVIALITLAFAGCGKNLPLSGKVTFADDGSPVPCGTVIFDDGKNMGKGPIQEDGTYVVGFEKKNNGIPRGTYRVRIVGAVQEVGETEATEDRFTGQKTEQMGMRQTVDLIDRKYRSLADSGLTFTADGTSSTYDIQVERFQ